MKDILRDLVKRGILLAYIWELLFIFLHESKITL